MLHNYTKEDEIAIDDWFKQQTDACFKQHNENLKCIPVSLTDILFLPLPDMHEQIISTLMKTMITTPTHIPITIIRLECFSSPVSLFGLGKEDIEGGEALGVTVSAGAGTYK